MNNKDKVILDKKLPYEYNICLYILEELCDKGVSTYGETYTCRLSKLQEVVKFVIHKAVIDF